MGSLWLRLASALGPVSLSFTPLSDMQLEKAPKLLSEPLPGVPPPGAPLKPLLGSLDRHAASAARNLLLLTPAGAFPWGIEPDGTEPDGIEPDGTEPVGRQGHAVLLQAIRVRGKRR